MSYSAFIVKMSLILKSQIRYVYYFENICQIVLLTVTCYYRKIQQIWNICYFHKKNAYFIIKFDSSKDFDTKQPAQLFMEDFHS